MAETIATTQKIPLVQIVVHRDGKPVRPEIGSAYGFTAAEIAEIEAAVPGALRDPINEAAATVVTDTAGKTATATVTKTATATKEEEL